MKRVKFDCVDMEKTDTKRNKIRVDGLIHVGFYEQHRTCTRCVN